MAADIKNDYVLDSTMADDTKMKSDKVLQILAGLELLGCGLLEPANRISITYQRMRLLTTMNCGMFDTYMY